MHITQLRELIDLMEAKGLTEVRCLDEYTDTSEDVIVKEVFVDINGKLVDEQRRQFVQMEPYNPKEYLEVYQGGGFDEHPTFKDFYQFMEGERLREVFLINSARPVVLVGAQYLPMT